MTVQELIEALQALPKDAQSKPVVIHDDYGQTEAEVDDVDYNLTVVTLK